jgi:hypothetical protein
MIFHFPAMYKPIVIAILHRPPLFNKAKLIGMLKHFFVIKNDNHYHYMAKKKEQAAPLVILLNSTH